MECPHCHQSLPSKTCPHCEAEVPQESVYCMACGGLIEMPQIDKDASFADRILCSDGTCIGVIGPDGKCKECGKPYRPGSEEE